MAIDDDLCVIQLFADSCETLNEFGRSLRESRIFRNARSSADIRNYRHGWRLEKYVEAEINPTEGFVVAWCLELGQQDGRWIVEANINVSHASVSVDIPDRFATNMTELKSALDLSVADLLEAANPDSPFVQEIQAL